VASTDEVAVVAEFEGDSILAVWHALRECDLLVGDLVPVDVAVVEVDAEGSMGLDVGEGVLNRHLTPALS
jgi:hypothetical protein